MCSTTTKSKTFATSADRVYSPEVTIISEDAMRAVILATPLRRAGVSVETFLTAPKMKKQFSRASAGMLLIVEGAFLRLRDTYVTLEGDSEVTVVDTYEVTDDTYVSVILENL